MCRLNLITGLCLIIAGLASSTRLVCYFDSEAEDRAEEGRFTISDIDPNQCTHLIYAFSDINDQNELVPKQGSDIQRYQSFNGLKSRNPLLKTLLAVGGLTFNTQKFSTMVAEEQSRAMFIQSAIQILRDNGFDGLNLDWRNPGGIGSQPQDKQGFTKLCKELKEAFVDEEDTNRTRLIITASVSAEKAIIDASYEVGKIAMYLDFINVLTFDFHGPWENVTGHHSPLYQGSRDTGNNVYANTDYAMRYWRDQGAPTEKLNLGIAAYGRAFDLSSSSSGVGAPATGPGEEGCYTGEEGFWASYETCLYLEGVTTQLITDQKVPYAVTEKQWVGFDNRDSLNTKVNYLKNNSFGGAFVWSLDLDDTSGQFCEMGKNPLISHLHTLLVPDFPDLPSASQPITKPPLTSSPITATSTQAITTTTTNTAPITTSPTTTTTTSQTTSPTTTKTTPPSTSPTTTTTSPTTITTTPPTTSPMTTTTTSPTTTPTTTPTSPTTTTTTSSTTSPKTTTISPTTTKTTPPTTSPMTTTTTSTTTSPTTTTTTSPTTSPTTTSPTTSPTTTTTSPTTTTTSPTTTTTTPPTTSTTTTTTTSPTTSPTTTTTSPTTTTTTPPTTLPTTTTTTPSTTSPTTTTTTPPTTSPTTTTTTSPTTSPTTTTTSPTTSTTSPTTTTTTPPTTSPTTTTATSPTTSPTTTTTTSPTTSPTTTTTSPTTTTTTPTTTTTSTSPTTTTTTSPTTSPTTTTTSPTTTTTTPPTTSPTTTTTTPPTTSPTTTTTSPTTTPITTTQATLSPGDICRSLNGHFAHPTDSHKYINCANGIAHEQICSGTLVFKQECGVCVQLSRQCP